MLKEVGQRILIQCQKVSVIKWVISIKMHSLFKLTFLIQFKKGKISIQTINDVITEPKTIKYD